MKIKKPILISLIALKVRATALQQLMRLVSDFQTKASSHPSTPQMQQRRQELKRVLPLTRVIQGTPASKETTHIPC